MATNHKYDFRGMAADPDSWITIPEFNVLPADVDGKGFDHFIGAPEIDKSIQGPIWDIIGSMRQMAKARFDSLADLYAANDRVLASGKRAEKGTDMEWLAWGYVYIFEALERWHHIHPFNKLEGSVWLANIANQALCMFSGGPYDAKSIQDHHSDFARKGAATKLAKSPKQQEKQLVRECWAAWQERPSSYSGKAEFARDMLSKFEHLKSQPVIEGWCLNWSREND